MDEQTKTRLAELIAELTVWQDMATALFEQGDHGPKLVAHMMQYDTVIDELEKILGPQESLLLLRFYSKGE